MTLQTKFLLSLIVGVAAVYAGAQYLQQSVQRGTVSRLAAANLAHEAAVQWRWVETVQRVAATALLDAMAEGELEKVRRLLEDQAKIRGVQEVSFYNIRGMATHSSHSAALRQKLPEELQEQLLTRPDSVRRELANGYEILQPMPVTPSCLECHPNFRDRAIGGVMTYRYSKDALHEARAQWTEFSRTLEEQGTRTASITFAALLAVVSGLTVWLVRSQITRPLNRVAERLGANSHQVRESAQAIAGSSQAIAAGASEQAASLEQSSASLTELAASTRQNAESAAGAEQSLRAGLTPGLERIQVLADQVQQALRESEQAGARTCEVVRVIDEIAFLTNLLALNAAVEAARAGEAGQGFAVVAGEVRSLAQRCSEASRNTQELVEKSRRLLVKTAQEFGGVSEVIDRTAALGQRLEQLVTTIHATSREQAEGVAQINSAVAQMDSVTQGNATGAEQNAAAAAELSDEARALAQAVSDLRAMIGRQSSAPSSAALEGATAGIVQIVAPRRTARDLAAVSR